MNGRQKEAKGKIEKIRALLERIEAEIRACRQILRAEQS